MAVSWQKAFIRDAKTKIWHTVAASASAPVRAACGVRFASSLLPGKARLYDLTSTWPGLATRRCGRCVKAGMSAVS